MSQLPALLLTTVYLGLLLALQQTVEAASMERVVGAAPGGQEDESAQEDRGRTTLLHTIDGRILRVRARLIDAGWEVRQGREWLALGEGFVLRAEDERELLSRARDLERKLRRDSSPEERVAYADWLVREGLYPESVKQLDRVFDQAPDCEAALALLARISIPLRLPDPATDLDRFIAQACQGSATGREIAILRLRATLANADDSTPGTLGVADPVAHFANEAVATSPRRRAFAALVLRRLFPGRAVKTLLGRSLLDASSDVRVEASRALKSVGDPAVAIPALRALDHTHPKVRLNAAESLGEMGYPETVEPMVSFLATAQSSGDGRVPHQHIFIGRQFAYVQDFDVEVAQFQAIADPIINVGLEGAVMDVAVLSVSQIQTQLATVRRSLVKLTGYQGRTNRAWREWWSQNGESWRARSKGAGPETPAR